MPGSSGTPKSSGSYVQGQVEWNGCHEQKLCCQEENPAVLQTDSGQQKLCHCCSTSSCSGSHNVLLSTATKRPSRMGSCHGYQYIGCWDRGLERESHIPLEEIKP
jgi:hypothetical protein